MASMALPSTHYCKMKSKKGEKTLKTSSLPRIISCQESNHPNEEAGQTRREIILRSSEVAALGAIFNFSGKKPDYLGVQKNYPALALCPATKNCISTSENVSDPVHYAPPWNYNSERRKKPVSREVAMDELIDVIETTTPGKFTPRIVERTDDYVHVEYQTPILGLVDDVEFWFPPGNKSIVEYRSASRLGNFDFDANRKRIKALRQELEKKGWSSADGF